MKKYQLLVLIILSNILCFSQETDTQFSDAIEDNSFFIEEAYNQEAGIVQHISNGTYFKSPQEDFVFTFTQEWPIGSQKHQFSYTLPYVFLNSNTVHGFGDVLLNYRYQLSSGEDGIAMSPRLSLMFPNSRFRNYDLGDWGLQFNLPISKRLNNEFITHINAGVTVFPQAFKQGYTTSEGPYQEDGKALLYFYNIGASLIYLADINYNFMLEIAENISSDFDLNGEIKYENELIISPGFRYAIDVNSLQIVPGIAVPFRITENETNAGFFLYLSLEGPF